MQLQRILFILRTAPYGSSLAKDGIDAVLAASVFEQDVSVLFMDDGVFQLQANQNAAELQQKNLSSNLKAFMLYDLDQIYACQPSLSARGLQVSDTVIPVTALGTADIQRLILQHDKLINF